MSIVFGTGHRPEDYSISFDELTELCEEAISDHGDIDVVVTGMAAGFDLAWGLAGLHQGKSIWTVRPWAGHRPRFDDVKFYDLLEFEADHHVITNDSLSYPGPWVYDVRNRWMVNNSDEGFAYWNGKKTGGTVNCINYAGKVHKPVRNLYI